MGDQDEALAVARTWALGPVERRSSSSSLVGLGVVVEVRKEACVPLVEVA